MSLNNCLRLPLRNISGPVGAASRLIHPRTLPPLILDIELSFTLGILMNTFMAIELFFLDHLLGLGVMA